ncbi:hypothetical protein [Halocatena halophila]|uniref:hypothetical protein n=1 Tax=Halocatena halophila TaxID=2814576 RepID=UPI002ED0B231
MPFTPFHLGPGLLGGVLFKRQLDALTFVLASVIVDFRAALVLFGLLGGRLHGPVHTYLGATVLSVVLTATVVLTARHTQSLNRINFSPHSVRHVLVGAIAGSWLHVTLDSVLYTDIRPFAPLSVNPLFGTAGLGLVYGGCLLALVVGCGVALSQYHRASV